VTAFDPPGFTVPVRSAPDELTRAALPVAATGVCGAPGVEPVVKLWIDPVKVWPELVT
jgi:hypothetical protein